MSSDSSSKVSPFAKAADTSKLNNTQSSCCTVTALTTLCPHRDAVPAKVAKLLSMSLKPRMVSRALMNFLSSRCFHLSTQRVSTTLCARLLGYRLKHPSSYSETSSDFFASTISIACFTISSLLRSVRDFEITVFCSPVTVFHTFTTVSPSCTR